MKTALNRITMPSLPLPEFLIAAKRMGFKAVEVRNDLPDPRILDGIDPTEVRKLCDELGLEIITINALQRFNDSEEHLEARVAELKELVFVAAIKKSRNAGRYRIVHDTFHHYLARERELYPEMTGLIHMSGVLGGKEMEDITDADRILVTAGDIMANTSQLDALRSGGYDGYCAFECFSPEVWELSSENLAKDVAGSLSLLS